MENISFDHYQGKNQVVQSPPNDESSKKHLILPSIWETLSIAGLQVDLNQMPPFPLDIPQPQTITPNNNPIKTSLSQYSPPKTKKRVLFTEKQRSILLDWLLKHSDNPYPTQSEKETLMNQTGLKRDQINVWFTNNRIRHGLCGVQNKALIYNVYPPFQK